MHINHKRPVINHSLQHKLSNWQMNPHFFPDLKKWGLLWFESVEYNAEKIHKKHQFAANIYHKMKCILQFNVYRSVTWFEGAAETYKWLFKVCWHFLNMQSKAEQYPAQTKYLWTNIWAVPWWLSHQFQLWTLGFMMPLSFSFCMLSL